MNMRMLSCALLALLALSLSGCGGSGPGSSAAAFMKAVCNNDSEAAKKYIAPEDLKDETAAMLPMIVGKMSAVAQEKKGVKAINVLSESVTGDTATVKLEVKFGDGTTETDDYPMKKVGGKWYVSN